MAVGSQYGITSFSISSCTVWLKIWDSSPSSLKVFPEDVHCTQQLLTDFNIWYYSIL